MTQDDLERIERYINGLGDNNEKEWLDSLFLKGEENLLLRYLLEKDWNQMVKDSPPSEVNLSHSLDRIHHKIRKNEDQKRKKLIHRITRVYIKVAAILMLPSLITGGLFYKHYLTQSLISIDQVVSSSIYAPMGARVSFNLPDGTVGMLNSGSQLCYSLPFTNKREITLEGEAWLDVCQDEIHPFKITSGTSSLRVFGTKFNLSAYPTEHYVEVVLEEGKVDYLNQEASIAVTMSPSERLVFENGQISRSNTDPSKYNAWTQGKLVFRGDPMSEVARRIERWYNVKIELGDKQLEKYTFRGTFQDDTLEEVLRFLSMTSPITYQIIPRMLLTDGTYIKEKVIIHLKKDNSNHY